MKSPRVRCYSKRSITVAIVIICVHMGVYTHMYLSIKTEKTGRKCIKMLIVVMFRGWDKWVVFVDFFVFFLAM